MNTAVENDLETFHYQDNKTQKIHIPQAHSKLQAITYNFGTTANFIIFQEQEPLLILEFQHLQEMLVLMLVL